MRVGGVVDKFVETYFLVENTNVSEAVMKGYVAVVTY
jgi:hypothetical protein